VSTVSRLTGLHVDPRGGVDRHPSGDSVAPQSGVEIGLLTGGGDKPYAIGLSLALTSRGVGLDFIGSDQLDSPTLHRCRNVRFLNLRGDQRDDVPVRTKAWRILTYYARIIRYAAFAQPRIFHILWNNKFQTFDRTLLMLYYKLLGKKIALTAHNVNAAKRDGSDSVFNRLTLRIQYRLSDHIFVHTERMKAELITEFAVSQTAVTVIPLGLNNVAPHTDLSPQQARHRLGLDERDKVLLFFGNIGPYKGLEYLVDAFQHVAAADSRLHLVIAGKPKLGAEGYVKDIQHAIDRDPSRGRIIQNIEFIPDEDTEVYFKAADVLMLPYTEVFQSGVLVLGYTFGLPVIASDVGSLREDIIPGRTGFVAKACDPVDLASVIDTYFKSDLFHNLAKRREEIRTYAEARYSWESVAESTIRVYAELSVA
jgi:D-inositol-3-phosphate glycosyltransferase